MKAIRKILSGKQKAEKHDPHVEAVAERTGRPYSEVLLEMQKVKEEHGISFRDYDKFRCEECSSEEDFEAKKGFIKRRKRLIRKLCEETGWSKEQAEEEIKRIQDKFDITPKKYYTCGLYAMDDEEIYAYLQEEKRKEKAAKEEKKGKAKSRDPYVKIVAERTGRPYVEVLNEMKKAREEYGITFVQYAIFEGENCTGKEDFDDLKIKINNRKEKRKTSIVKKLCNVTNWTEEEARDRIKHFSETFGLSGSKYYKLGYYRLDDDGIREALNEEKEREKEVKARVIEESGWTGRMVKNHMKYASLKYGMDANDYLIIKAWRLSDEELSSLSRLSVVKELTHKYNNMRSIDKLADKLIFDKTYSDCIMRKFWANEEQADFESFCAFWEGMDEAMLKPLNLSRARGVEKIKRPADLKKAYEGLKNGPRVLLEEVVKQHPDIDAIYSKSVNTVRMVTLLKDDEFHVVCSFMRFGKGGTVVDNMFAGGMIAGVDEKKGIVDTGAVDRDGNVHDYHPDTGKQIKGFRIPNYDKVLEITEKALRKDPDINFVGWDVAVCEDNAVIIEGNSRPDPVAYQLPYMTPPLNEPKLYKFEPYL